MDESKEDPKQLAGEMVGMEHNLETLSLMAKFLSRCTISAADARDMARCLNWIEGMSQGTAARINEIKAKLPKPEVAVGAVEIQKGEPVLGAV